MKITSALFEAHLKCATKCWLRSKDEPAAGNAYAEWVQTQNDSYRTDAAKRLKDGLPADECVVAPPAENLKLAKWRLALDMPVRIELCSSRGNEAQISAPEISDRPASASPNGAQPKWIAESRLHAVERLSSEGRGKAAQFIPNRFIFTNKLGKNDKLLLAFDAFLLSEMLGREVRLGKIIHGDDHATLKVKTSALAGEVRKRLDKIAALLSNPSTPELVLNRHCAECEFRARCRQKALEQDDLSLLAGMSEKERQKLRSKGIFTVTQLSYTFRPRRRPKRLRDKREKYHHSLKALAIREKKIHIVGNPELKIDGTPVYLDVEGLPDRDFYYLIGIRIGNGESAVQHSLWANSPGDEGKAWDDFVAMLAGIEKPVLIHYGSYETNFLRTMCERYGAPEEESTAAQAIKSARNLISIIFAQIYFPSFSSGLKEIAGYLGFAWSDPNPSGLCAVVWRHSWDMANSATFKDRLLAYNTADCQALEILTSVILGVTSAPLEPHPESGPEDKVVHTELLPRKTMWPTFSSPIIELEQANKAARWDYQRDRVYVRSSKRIKRVRKNADELPRSRRRQKINKLVVIRDKPPCPKCGGVGQRPYRCTKMLLYDLVFGKNSLKKWIVEYQFPLPWCGHCQIRYGLPKGFWPGMNCGRNLSAYVIYQCIELYIPQLTVQRSLARLFDLHFGTGAQIHRLKTRAADFYRETHRRILDRIAHGDLVHVDETRANVRGRAAYVWVFANLHEVAYLYSDSRESEVAKTTLVNFQGVLVSDFYSGYDSLACLQQKCLLHLIRDLNADLLRNPYDEELRQVVNPFARLLKEVIETVDRFGLKKHFLNKHHSSVNRFYREMEKKDYQSETAIKCKQRFEKNRANLFTFLDHDGVPWNNNNAEHAIKAFAALREVMRGSSTEKGIQDYLVLLSVCQTCKYSGVDFLDFLRSGQKDIHAFAESRRGSRRQTQTNQRTDSPVRATPDQASSPLS